MTPPRRRRVDRSATLIRNAGLDLPLPIAPLAVTLRLFASFALLISSVGFTPLPAERPPHSLAADTVAASVTTDAYKEVVTSNRRTVSSKRWPASSTYVFR